MHSVLIVIPREVEGTIIVTQASTSLKLTKPKIKILQKKQTQQVFETSWVYSKYNVFLSQFEFSNFLIDKLTNHFISRIFNYIDINYRISIFK